MRHSRYVLSAALIALLAAAPCRARAEDAPTITAPQTDIPGDDKDAQAKPADSLGLEEYDQVPEGMLAGADSETKADPNLKAAKPMLPLPYGQIPGVFAIPGVQQEDAEDDNNLSFDQITAAYKKKKYAVVLKNLNPLVDAHRHDAEQLLGIMYLNGQGVPQDSAKAFDLFKKAAEDNMPLSQHYLGVMYYTGNGTGEAPDPIQGLMWLHIAILHYPDGPEKERAKSDRDGIYVKLTRVEKNRALQMARDWLDKKGEGHLLDLGLR